MVAKFVRKAGRVVFGQSGEVHLRRCRLVGWNALEALLGLVVARDWDGLGGGEGR